MENNKPLTEEDFELIGFIKKRIENTPELHTARFGDYSVIQSAKRLSKSMVDEKIGSPALTRVKGRVTLATRQYLTTLVKEIIDACFQIPDGDKE